MRRKRSKRFSAKILILIALLLGVVLWVVFIRFPLRSSELAQPSPDTAIRVVTLGTGSPVPSVRRFGPSTLVQAGGHTLIFDAGRGAMQRLFQLNIPVEELNNVFISHLHSDHLLDLDDLFLTSWTFGRDNRFDVWGPPGINSFVSHTRSAYAYDIAIRIEDSDLPEPLMQSHEIVHEGTIFDEDGVRVIAFLVDHSPIEPAYGFKVEYANHSVVISGDTRFSENLVDYAQNADLIIHEVAFANPGTLPAEFETAFAHHTSPQQAGTVFKEAMPRLAVYSHIVLYPGTSEKNLIHETRKTYDGPLTVADDLTVFDIGTDIKIRRLKNPIGRAQLLFNRAKNFFGD